MHLTINKFMTFLFIIAIKQKLVVDEMRNDVFYKFQKKKIEPLIVNALSIVK